MMSPTSALRRIRAGGVPGGVFFEGTSGGFTEALERSVEFAGAANYCPVIVGAISGARWGGAAVPAAALVNVAPLLPRVRAVADALAAGWIEGKC